MLYQIIRSNSSKSDGNLETFVYSKREIGAKCKTAKVELR